MKYVCIVSTSGVGGIWSVVRYSLPLLKDHYDVSLVLYTKNNNLQEDVIKFLDNLSIKYIIINFNVTNGWLFDIYKAWNIKSVRQFIGNQPAIVHCHDSYMAGAVLPFLQNKKYSLFCTIHGAMFDAKTWKMKIKNWFDKNVRCRMLERSNVTIISCDPNTIPIIHKYFPKTKVIQLAVNGVPAGEGTQRNKKKSPFVIGYMSRFHPLKRWDLVAESALALNESGYNVKVVFAGAGEDEDKVCDWCRNHHSFAEYLGNVEDVSNELLPQIHVNVLPTQYPEGLPMILLESMAAGVPSITTTEGSCAYAVKDGVNGFITEPNKDIIAERLKVLIEDNELYDKMASNALEMWRDHFSDNAMVEQYISIFNQTTKT